MVYKPFHKSAEEAKRFGQRQREISGDETFKMERSSAKNAKHKALKKKILTKGQAIARINKSGQDALMK